MVKRTSSGNIVDSHVLSQDMWKWWVKKREKRSSSPHSDSDSDTHSSMPDLEPPSPNPSPPRPPPGGSTLFDTDLARRWTTAARAMARSEAVALARSGFPLAVHRHGQEAAPPPPRTHPFGRDLGIGEISQIWVPKGPPPLRTHAKEIAFPKRPPPRLPRVPIKQAPPGPPRASTWRPPVPFKSPPSIPGNMEGMLIDRPLVGAPLQSWMSRPQESKIQRFNGSTWVNVAPWFQDMILERKGERRPPELQVFQCYDDVSHSVMTVNLELMHVTDYRDNLSWMRELKQTVIWNRDDVNRLDEAERENRVEQTLSEWNHVYQTLNKTLWLCRFWFKYSDMHWQWMRNDGTWENVEHNMNEEMLRHALDMDMDDYYNGRTHAADFEELWCSPGGRQNRTLYKVDFENLRRVNENFGFWCNIRLVAETCALEGGPKPKYEVPSHEPFSPRW